MLKFRKHIAIFLILIFIYPEASASLHFWLFHHQEAKSGHASQFPVIYKKQVECYYDDIKYPPFTEIKASYSFFLFVSTSKTLVHQHDEPTLKRRYLFKLRAPPLMNIEKLNDLVLITKKI